jgi:pimeloyl-ACP methyl ester carboxylesterase
MRPSCIPVARLMLWRQEIAKRFLAAIVHLGEISTMPAQAAPTPIIVTRGDVRLEVLVQGDGPPIVLLPSLGRGAGDFDEIAKSLAEAGYRVLRPQPRGIGASRGPWDGIKLEDLAADIAAVIDSNAGGPAFVVGHAFGNRVARTLATVQPDDVKAVGLVAANVGHNPSPPDVRSAIRLSADVTAPDAARIKAMQFVFFAPGNDASVWLKGWHPVLYIQPSHDPLAHVEDAEEYKKALGERVTVVVVPNAAHAVIVEQPKAVSDALIAYARRLWPAR